MIVNITQNSAVSTSEFSFKGWVSYILLYSMMVYRVEIYYTSYLIKVTVVAFKNEDDDHSVSRSNYLIAKK